VCLGFKVWVLGVAAAAAKSGGRCLGFGFEFWMLAAAAARSGGGGRCL
jgi:hypothetical protein